MERAVALPVGQVDPDGIAALRGRVEAHLVSQGFGVRNGHLITPVLEGKERLRVLHSRSVDERRAAAAGALQRYEDSLIAELRDGAWIDPARVQPRLVEVTNKNSHDARLWRWATLHWSIPVSAGYGRRLRFLVRDAGHDDALIGVIGLGDPVYALAARDKWVGWTHKQKQHRLTSVMDAYALGAVPPYSGLLGGKLVALLAGSAEVVGAFEAKYAHRETLIRSRDPNARLALITTTSALGRSSIYNRLRKPDGTLAYFPIGFTSGTGDFHLSGPIYKELVDVATAALGDSSTHRHELWGNGFRNRREVIQRALYALGFDGYAMRAHGIRRQVFAVPVVRSAQKYLRGEINQPWRASRPTDEIADWWRTRWAIPRSGRIEPMTFDPESWRLWERLAPRPSSG